ncbi:MAG: amidohydrolase family protein [Gammaproteobacteria bacterium]|nr:amidohydrolase family protein [Gammaproteobacteria bacterium]MDE0511776.1 amidohydrolase family protein [Gammaproteobacteria bacterium]
MLYRYLQKLLLIAGNAAVLLFCCQAVATPYWITGGTLIDGTGAEPRPNPGIFINEGNIISLGRPDNLSADAREINAEGKWVLPGLFDLHAHITFKLAGARDLEDDVINALRSERFLERYQEIGVTVVRDVASRYHVGYSLKRAQRGGLIGGARIYVSGPLITTTGGHATEFQPLIPPIWAVEADGPWEFRKRVREAAKLGADLIKTTTPYTLEELSAAVEEAHLWKLRLTAHLGGAQDPYHTSGRIAVDAGVDSMEHLYPFGDDDVYRDMVEKNINLVPTIGYHLRELDGQYTYSADYLEKHLGHTYEGMVERFRRMHELGVKFAVGTDSNAKDLPTIDKIYLQELEGFTLGGLTHMEIIQGATLIGAETMGLDGEAGSIEAGKWGDVILLASDPLESLEALVKPVLVVQNGRVVFERDK